MNATVSYTFLERFLWNFYIHDIDKVNVKDVNNMPDFLTQMTPILTVCILVEEICLYAKGKPLIRINNGITSMGTGLMMSIFKALPTSIEFYGYSLLYEYRFFDLNFDSRWMWWVTALLVDFCYYWVHRASHEVHFLWALGHQVHHSSEDYNLTTATRQSVFLKFLNHGLYHPLALLGFPLATVMVHVQFNLIYQFWIHTEVIDNIGALEYVLNTASHHRVHHGMNNWCLDKNYGSILIIWDRMFGTFAAEKKDEQIIYGLVEQPQTFEPLHLQSFYIRYTVGKAWAMDSVPNFLKGLLFGPAWYPGGPRLGDEVDTSERPKLREKFDPKIPWFINVYIGIHFSLTLLVHQMFILMFPTYSWISVVMFSVYIFWTLSINGSIFNGDFSVGKMEVIRCLLAAAFLEKYIAFGNATIDMTVTAFHGLSALFWLYLSQVYNQPSQPVEAKQILGEAIQITGEANQRTGESKQRPGDTKQISGVTLHGA